MADNTIIEHVKITGDSKDAQKAYKDLEGRAKKTFTAAAVAGNLYTKAIETALGAVVALGGELKKGVLANLEYQRTTTALVRALEDSGQEAGKNLQTLQFLSAQMESLTGISDETIRATQTLAINMGVGADKSHEFTQAAVRLSRVTGMDLHGAMKQLVKSTGGLAGELGEAIPAIRSMTKEQLQAGEAVGLINELWESQLELADNMDGTLTRLGASWDSFTETVTQSATSFEPLKNALDGIADALDDINVIFAEGGVEEGLEAMLASIAESPWISFLGPGGAALGGIGGFIGQSQMEGGSVAMEAAYRRADAAARLDPLTGKAGGGGGGGGLPKGKGKGKGRRTKAKMRDIGSSPEPGEVIFIGGVPVDVETGLVVAPPAPPPPDPQAAAELEARNAELAQRLAMGQIEAEQIKNDAIQAITKQKNDWRIEDEKRVQAALAAEQARAMQVYQDTAMDTFNTVGSIASQGIMTGLNAIYEMADGQKVVWEEVAKAFLKNTGFQLIAQSTKHGFDSIAAFIMEDYPRGVAMAALASGEAAAGTAMIAGSLAIKPPVGGASGIGNISDGAAGAGGTTGGRGSGDVTENITVNIKQIGSVGPDEASRLANQIDDARRRGFN